MYSNIMVLKQYFNTALCATSIMRHGSWLSVLTVRLLPACKMCVLPLLATLLFGSKKFT